MTISKSPNKRKSNELYEAPIKSYSNINSVINVPNLLQIQLDAMEWLKGDGLSSLFSEVSPIDDFTGHRLELSFLSHEFREPKHSISECREKEITFSRPLYVNTQLIVKETGEIKEQSIFFGDIPMMTEQGTFIINGAERVVVSQLVRSPGVYYTVELDTSGRPICSAKLIPYRGAWLEFETSARDQLVVKVDRKRKAPITLLLRALGYISDEEILELFASIDDHPDHKYIETTLSKDPIPSSRYEDFRESDLESTWLKVKGDTPYDPMLAKGLVASRIEFYRRLRPGEPASIDNANTLIDNLLFNPRRYDLGTVGSYKMGRQIESRKNSSETSGLRVLNKKDIVDVITKIIYINNGHPEDADDIDHLGNRRVRAVGELIQNQLRLGVLRMERVIKERMTIIEPENATPAALVNIRPVVAAIREFFGGSQLSQFMDQTNPLAELTHKRRLSALGPGGLSRERAGFEVRDVHNSHYGRICPIETPEGPNIGLLGSLATYGRTNQYGFIETPYRKVFHQLQSSDEKLLGRTVSKDLNDDSGKLLVKGGSKITSKILEKIKNLNETSIPLRPFVTLDSTDIEYLPADDEQDMVIAQANIPVDEHGQFVPDTVETRTNGEPRIQDIDLIHYMDVSPMQIVSVSTSLIPFLEHDDANRALMGSNMQRQAVPLIRPDAPLVGTGMESRVALDSGQVILSETDGVVTGVSGDEIIITEKNGDATPYPLQKFVRSNQSTCVNQRPVVNIGQKIKIGDTLADSSSTDKGELALGHNLLVAFMSWEGYNFEDAIILSEELVKDDKFTSVHIEKYECQSRQTKLGEEEITRDIPNVSEDALRNLDELGIIRIGAEVSAGDILVGKITPKGETELSAEEKLLRAIFGEKARDVKDTSLKVPHGERGKVIAVKVFSRENRDELPPNVNEVIRVWVAQTRKISVGDKMAGRHGNKGVIARILPVEDMPYTEDGTPIQIILNPIGVPSRMNLGQILETHLGLVADSLNFRAITPVFDGATDEEIQDGLAHVWFLKESNAIDLRDLDNPIVDWDIVKEWLENQGYNFDDVFNENNPGFPRRVCLEIWLKEHSSISLKGKSDEELFKLARNIGHDGKNVPPIMGKMVLHDGRTGEQFAQPVTVGYIYMMKLIHLVEDKIHARSTGPYSLITQQPLGGKAQFGGQRFGEMEVWALEAYSAAHNLQEMLTVKSDDVMGRQKTYESIVKGDEVSQPGVPESFQVLLKEMQALSLSVELLNENSSEIPLEDTFAQAQNVLDEIEYDGPENTNEYMEIDALFDNEDTL
ncbi:MAG: DNA-directed RNA polymerase subunit beta [Chloroflexi bacterium]|nr:DNA-directed RNA polymerase subunit beta [Chloroflexota bacterium]|tara:strand:- start:31488 stop:35345 length:3858 start_codon:yes stop_codon:yes gene_type:complete